MALLQKTLTTSILKCTSVRSISASLPLRAKRKDANEASKKEKGPEVIKCVMNKVAHPPTLLDPCTAMPKVVIIGAGMAGLSVAHTLSINGMGNYIVLESHNRPGGRIYSCFLGDAIGELGAQWISGGNSTNSVFNLACLEGIMPSPLPRKEPLQSRDLLFLTNEGRAIEGYISENGFRKFKEIQQEAMVFFSLNTVPPQNNLGQFISSRVEEEVGKLPEGRRLDSAIVFSSLKSTLRGRWGTDLNDIPSDQFGSYIDIPGAPVRVPKGLTGTLAPLLRVIPPEKLKFCKAVKQVQWGRGKPRALVVCCDGEEIPADYVVVTVPLGVLKEEARNMFYPQLPEQKTNAIEKIGYGHLNKIFVEYEKPFWARGDGYIRLGWTSDDPMESISWVRGISSIEELPDSRNKLIVTVAGREAREIECYTADALAETFTLTLRRFTGDPTIPYPKNLMLTKWSSDKHFMGAFSYLSLTTKVSDQCALGAPLPGLCEPGPPILMFAGEATCPGLFSTVQGARVSGIREAQRIINLTKKYNGPPRDEPMTCVVE